MTRRIPALMRRHGARGGVYPADAIATLFDLSVSPLSTFPETVLSGDIPAAFHTDMEWAFRTTLGFDQTDSATHHLFNYDASNRFFVNATNFRIRIGGTTFDVARPGTFGASDRFDIVHSGGALEVFHNTVSIGSVSTTGSYSGLSGSNLEIGARGGATLWSGDIYSPTAP